MKAAHEWLLILRDRLPIGALAGISMGQAEEVVRAIQADAAQGEYERGFAEAIRRADFAVKAFAVIAERDLLSEQEQLDLADIGAAIRALRSTDEQSQKELA